MLEIDDWRLENSPDGAQDATLRRLKYKQPSAMWDHEHCIFCWQKIAEPHIQDSVHEGYAFAGDRDWVCPQCFTDMSKHFNWSVVDETGS